MMRSPGMAKWLQVVPFILAVALLVIIPSKAAGQSPHCANGIAVPDLANNLGLFDDCVTLLAARDTLAGSRSLDWSASVYIGSWRGVFVSGSPRRVYQLRTYGVTGTIPPELGNLTNLERLDLSRNSLNKPAELAYSILEPRGGYRSLNEQGPSCGLASLSGI